MIAALSAILFFLGTSQALVVPSALSGLVARDASCPANTPLSCTSPSVPSGTDKCCFETPGGVLLLTQFWDYKPPKGPVDEFTIHGLWPDNCDGTYEQYCDASLEIQGSVMDIVVGEFGDKALYDYMSGHWKGLNGDEDLWIHEFDKHGTCINTIKPDCYSSYSPHRNAYDYFRITVNLHKKYNSYQYLAAANILPSATKTYTKTEIQNALNAGFGGNKVYFTCDSSGSLSEIWYFHHLQGSLLGENFVPMGALSNSGCSATGIKYPPKTTATTVPTTSGGPTATSDPTTEPTGTVPASGYIRAGSKPGCIISAGKYYESGTCATFRFDGSIKSSKGFCTVNASNAFTCASGIAATQFTYTGNQIGFEGVYDWCLGAASGSPPQTTVLLARNGACDGKATFKLTA